MIGRLLLAAVLLAPFGAAARGRDAPAPIAVVSREVLEEVNYARTDPAGYADARLRNFPMDGARQADAFMRRQMPIGPIEFDGRLADAAQGHASDIGPRGSSMHVGADGSKPMARAQRAGVYSMTVAEEISVGQVEAADVVRILIIDPGVANFAHRTDLLDPHLTYGGVGCAPHAAYRVVCVIDMTGPLMAR